MPRRSIWSARQRGALLNLPADEAALLRHYTLSDDDIEQIQARRGAHNRLGFALQLDFAQNPKRAMGVPTLGRYDVLQAPEGFSLSVFPPDI